MLVIAEHLHISKTKIIIILLNKNINIIFLKNIYLVCEILSFYLTFDSDIDSSAVKSAFGKVVIIYQYIFTQALECAA